MSQQSKRIQAGSQRSEASCLATASGDERLMHFFQFAEMNTEEICTLISSYGVSTFDKLIRKLDDFKRTKLRHVSRRRQVTLYQCIMWYQDYLRIFEEEPDLRVKLTQDAFDDFMCNDFRIPFPKGESLKHIFTTLYSNSNSLQIRLADLGIKTFDEVVKNRKALGKGEFGAGTTAGEAIPPEIQKKLSQAADWFDEFIDENGREPSMQTEFNAEVFNAFVEKYHYRYNLNIKEFYTLAKLSIHKDQRPEFMNAFRENERADVYKQIIEHGVKDVKENFMSDELHEKAPPDVDSFITYWVSRLINFEKNDTYKLPYVRAGSTQSGKSAVKAIILAVCNALGVPAVAVTKEVRMAKALLANLQDFANQDNKELIVGISSLRKNKKNNFAEAKRAFENGGALVVADTKNHMEKVNDFLNEYLYGRKFVAIIDEADSMYRTYDKSQAFECAYDKFMNMHPYPCMRFFITATPVPALLALQEEDEVEEIKFDKTTPCDDYMGVDQMKTLKDEEGSDIFLEQGELRYNQGIKYRSKKIPFTNDRVLEMYKDAAIPEEGGSPKRTLLLDITDNRVNAAGNVGQKAELVQAFLKDLGADIAVLVNIGKGISYRLPNNRKWSEYDKEIQIKEALDSIRDGEKDGDNNVVRQGFTGPIFAFGFSLFRRGFSYRGSMDVPTHLVLQMGNGHNIENVVQSVGRGTFIGKQTLLANGHTHVKVLMPEHDWNMVQAYVRYVDEVDKRTSHGENVFDAMAGAVEALPDYANYLHWTKRRTGMRSKNKPNPFDEMHNPSFKVSTHLSNQDQNAIQWYAGEGGENKETYRIAKICWSLWQKEAADFDARDIVDAFNDKYRGRPDVKPTCKTRVLAYMRKHIVKDNLISEKPCEEKRTKRYSLESERCKKRLDKFLLKIRDLRGQHKKRRAEDMGDSGSGSSASSPNNSRNVRTKVEEDTEDGIKRESE